MAKKSADKSTMAKAKDMVVGAAEAVAGAVSDAAKSAKKHVVVPAAEAVGILDKKPTPKKKVVAKAPPAKAEPVKASAKVAPKKPAAKKPTPAAKAPPAKGTATKAKAAK